MRGQLRYYGSSYNVKARVLLNDLQWGTQITRPKIRSFFEKPSLFGLFRYLQILTIREITSLFLYSQGQKVK